MEMKSNIRQRRMDRMKQILASEREEYPHPAAPSGAAGSGRHYHTYPDGRPGVPIDSFREAVPMQQEYGPEDDPEYVWKRQEKERWSSFEQGPRIDDRFRKRDVGLKPPSKRQIWIKLALSAALFGGVWGMFRIDHPLTERGRQWVSAALTEDYNFAAAAAWYERNFGGLPAFLPAFGEKTTPQAQKANSSSLQHLIAPIHGKIVEAAKEGELGITIRTEPEASVAAIDTGRVTAVNTATDKGTVLVVQHANGLQSTYGWLQSTNLKVHDWVKGGETIGVVTTDAAGGAGKLYVAVKKDNQSLDPAEVIPFD